MNDMTKCQKEFKVSAQFCHFCSPLIVGYQIIYTIIITELFSVDLVSSLFLQKTSWRFLRLSTSSVFQLSVLQQQVLGSIVFVPVLAFSPECLLRRGSCVWQRDDCAIPQLPMAALFHTPPHRLRVRFLRICRSRHPELEAYRNYAFHRAHLVRRFF